VRGLAERTAAGRRDESPAPREDRLFAALVLGLRPGAITVGACDPTQLGVQRVD
jgi:hypothetical protein